MKGGVCVGIISLFRGHNAGTSSLDPGTITIYLYPEGNRPWVFLSSASRVMRAASLAISITS